MKTRAFEFLFLSWALASLAVHFDYMQDVVAFEHTQRAAQFRAIRHAIRSVDPAKLYAPSIIAPAPPVSDDYCFSAADPLCISIDEAHGELDELELRLRDLYIRGLLRRGEAWSA